LWARLDVRPCASRLFADYVRQRAGMVADAVLDDLALEVPGLAEGEGVADVQLWLRPILRASLVEALEASPAFGGTAGPFPTDEAAGASWLTEPSAGRRVGAVVLDLLRRGLELGRPEGTPARQKLIGLRRELHRELRYLEREEQPLEDHKRDSLAKALPAQAEQDAARSWAEEAVGALGNRLSRGAEALDAVVGILVRSIPALREACDGPLPTQAGAAKRLGELIEEIVPSEPAHGALADRGPEQSERQSALLGLLALDVLQVTLGGPQAEHQVELMQISGDTANGFTNDHLAKEKLAGLQLGHFGAFLKQSWRASDWLWGRLDGAQRLSEMLVDPFRLRQRFSTKDDAVARIESIALGPPGSAARAVLEDESWPRPWDLAAVEAELHFLDEARLDETGDPSDLRNPQYALPASLPFCAQFVARRLQLEILCEELPRLAKAVRADEDAGAAASKASALADAIAPGTEVLAPKDAAELFLKEKVGQERIANEIGTDPFALTAAKAAAVAGSVVHKAGRPVKPLGFVLRVARGFSLGFYLMVSAAVAGDAAGTLLVALLAAGGALVAVGAFSTGLASAVFLVGIGLLVAGSLLVLLRGAGLALVVMLIFAALVAAAPDLLDLLTSSKRGPAWRPISVSVALVVLGLMLGFVGKRKRRP
jgi:hypothetical protein